MDPVPDRKANVKKLDQGTKSDSTGPDLEPSEKPTLKTLSRLSGLAVATVSRALGDAPDISKATKKKVRKIADQVGYVPNRAGVRLRTGKTNVIALVLGTGADMMTHIAQLITAITEELRNTPYHLIVMPRLPDEDPMRAVRYIVETGSADGIIMNQTEARDPRVKYLLDKRFPFATHGRTMWMNGHPYFDYDNEAFAQQAVRHLFARGRKCMYFMLPPDDQCYSQHLRKGAMVTAAELGVEMHFNSDVTSDSPVPEIRAAIGAALRSSPEIDAIVCSSPSAAMAAVSTAEASGKILGRDIDVVCKETSMFLKDFRNAIISAPEDVRKAGRFLARALIQSIQEPDKSPLQGLDVPNNEFR